jgi:hypothetical protein
VLTLVGALLTRMAVFYLRGEEPDVLIAREQLLFLALTRKSENRANTRFDVSENSRNVGVFLIFGF